MEEVCFQACPSTGGTCLCVWLFSQGECIFFERIESPVPLQSYHSKHSMSRCLTDFNLGRKEIMEEKLFGWAVCHLILLQSIPVASFLGSSLVFPSVPLVCLWDWNWNFQGQERLLLYLLRQQSHWELIMWACVPTVSFFFWLHCIWRFNYSPCF